MFNKKRKLKELKYKFLYGKSPSLTKRDFSTSRYTSKKLTKINHPFFNKIKKFTIIFIFLLITIFSINGIAYQITVFADLFTILWLLGMAYTTKFLDGLDGLVSGIGVVASFVVFGISLLPEVNQSHTAILSLALAGACFGFLIWNWHPAKIFLGEGGSLLIGFMLGVLSIISGGKIATALLVMGIPIFDVLWVIGRRLFIEKKSIFQADRKHLHFRLLDAGFTVRQSVGIFLFLSALFGGLAIILRGKDKLLLLLGTILAMIILVGFVVRKYQKENKKTFA